MLKIKLIHKTCFGIMVTNNSPFTDTMRKIVHILFLNNERKNKEYRGGI